MSKRSILEDLQAEITRGERWGYTLITHARLKSIIRKHETIAPGDISDQPGQWQIRGGNVDAIQHDGTEAGARKIRGWINERGGNSEWTNTYHEEVDEFRIRLDSPRKPNVVGPGWWVIKTADEIFFAVPDSDFHILYVPRE